ncbi:MAG: DEAD/DEAH box helicase [Coriobacteriia bacterium]
MLSLRDSASLLRDPGSRAVLMDLLTPEAADELAVFLGLDVEGPIYDRLKSLRVVHGSYLESKLFEFFSVPIPLTQEEPDTHESLDVVQGQYSLFEYQRSVASRASTELSREPRRLLLHMPTGAGKTRTTMHLIARHLVEREPTLVLWLAYSDELCEQAASEFERAWGQLGNRDVAVARYWGNHDPGISGVRDGLLVAGLSKVYARTKRSIDFIARLADRTSLVVIDEAHQAIAETYRLVLETVFSKRPDTALLGLTATPGRTWDNIHADRELADFFARKKVTLDVSGFANPMDFLIREGFLAEPTFEPLHYDGGADLTIADLNEIARNLDIPDRIIRTLAEDAQRNLHILLKIEGLARKHQRIIVFAATVEHAELLAAVLSARSVAAFSVTSRTSVVDRQRAISQFRSVKTGTMVLCNYGVLTTGFDAPRTSAAVIARPTKSLVLYSQMVGRAIRGPRAGGNAEATIVTVVDRGLPGFGDVGDAFLNWEDVWD